LARNQISDNEEDFQKTISNPLYWEIRFVFFLFF
jgi:hypothetical protein